MGAVSTFLFFSSVLFHEMSHSLVANAHGVQVRRITLFIFGGVSHLTQESPSPSIEVRVAAAGPMASFALGIGFLGVSRLTPDPDGNLWAGMASHLGWLNIILGLFNLLPGFPLDGGRVLRALWWSRSGDRVRATRVAAAWGRALGWSLILLGGLGAVEGNLLGGLWLLFIGLFLMQAAAAERRQALAGQALSGVRVGDVMVPSPVALPAWSTVQEAIDAFFLQHGYGGFPVVDLRGVVGVVSLADLRKCDPGRRAATRVSEIMTALHPEQLPRAGDHLTAAMGTMAAAGVSRLPVVEAGHLVGLVTLEAVARRIRLGEIAGARGARGAD